MYYYIYFFFQAEDGIRDYKVTGVQTCALPISLAPAGPKTVGRRLSSPDAPGSPWRAAAIPRDCATAGPGARPRLPASRPSTPGTLGTNGVLDLARDRSPPPARRLASERSDRRGFSRAGPGAERKTTG